MTSEEKSFIQGYVCACANMLNNHGCDVTVKECLTAIGFHRIDLKIVDQADKDALRKYGLIPRKPAKRKAP